MRQINGKTLATVTAVSMKRNAFDEISPPVAEGLLSDSETDSGRRLVLVGGSDCQLQTTPDQTRRRTDRDGEDDQGPRWDGRRLKEGKGISPGQPSLSLSIYPTH